MTVTYSTERNTAVNSFTAVSNIFITEYAKDAPPKYTAVYLYALMQHKNPAFVNDDIALALDMTEEEVCSAFDYWQRTGLLQVLCSSPLHVEFCTARTTYSGTEKLYASLTEKLRPILGTRILKASELKKVYDWIEVFGIEEDAVVALFIYCLETKGSRTSVSYMDEIAKGWADANIRTAKDAESYIKAHNEFNSGVRDIMQLLGMRRNPTKAEEELYIKWRTEYGLSREFIKNACAYTVTANSPSFAYLSKIVDDLYTSGKVDTDALAEEMKSRMKSEDFARELCKAAGLKSRPNASQKERIERWRSEYRMPDDVLKYVAGLAAKKANPFAYMNKSIEVLHDADILNLEGARKELDANSIKSTQVVSPAASGYIRRHYTAEDLDKIGINFDDIED